MTTRVMFDLVRFRQDFPEFDMESDESIQRYYQQATCQISPVESMCLNGDCLILAINLMTAHLCNLVQLRRTGKQAGIVTSATVGRVSVSQEPPPYGTSQWSWWLNGTPYGAEFAALLDSLSEAGMYYGGSCERQGFRKIGGIF